MIQRIHDLETGEIIDLPLPDNEIAERLEYAAKKQAEAEAKEAARQALLDKLGITEDEAKLLLG
jgi:hypothetical protein